MFKYNYKAINCTL